MPSIINASSYLHYFKRLEQMVADEQAAPYVAYIASYIRPFDESAADRLLMDIIRKYPDNNYVSDAVISSIPFKEEEFKVRVEQVLPDTNLRIHKQLQAVIANFKSKQKNNDPAVIAKEFPRGAALFLSTCQTCHAADGNGVASLAPPLNKSEWVTGNKNKLISIVLYGLTGPVKVNNKLYKAPEISADMPGIAHTEEISDEDIADLLSFIRRSWENEAGKVAVKEVSEIRKKLKGREKPFTQEELEAH